MTGRLRRTELFVFLLFTFPFLCCAPAYGSFTITDKQQFTLTGNTLCSFAKDCEESVVEIPLFLNKFDDGYGPYLTIDALAITPEPTRIKVDADGNMRAVYENFHTKGTLNVRQIAWVEARHIKFIPAGSYSGDTAFRKYIAPSDFIESAHPKIVKKADQLTKGIKNPYQKARKIYSFVQLHMTYDTSKNYANKGALFALETGRGVCDDYSALMVALLRAGGIPARHVGGYAFDYDMKHVFNGRRYILADGSRWLEKDDGSNVSGNSRHGWVEFYLKGEGWVPADPTTSDNEASLYPDWSTFGALSSRLWYIPDGIGRTFSTSFRVNGGFPVIQGNVKVIKGYQSIGQDYNMVFSSRGGSKLPVPYYLPYKVIGVSIDGETREFSPPGLVKAGNSLLPVRPLFEALGAVLQYDGKRKAVDGYLGSTYVSLTIGSKRVMVNGEPEYMEIPAQMIGGTVYVPAMFVSQAFGTKVSWDKANRQIIIETKKGRQ